ncbi:cation:proton antiporter [Tistrella bauzanensis]
MQDLVLTAAIVLSLGITAQWLAWRFKIPAIVLLAVGGILAGPVTGILDPHAQLGDMLEPLVAVAVAIILFEGGISLDLRELRGTASGVRRLTLVGAPVGWLAGTIAAHYVAGLSWPTAAVLGGILVVTGPTVIAPCCGRRSWIASPPSP